MPYHPHPASSRSALVAVAALSSSADERLAKQVDSFFESIDENSDGVISFDELEGHLHKLGFGDGAIDHIFDLLDINRDGEIEKLELRQSFAKFDDPAIRLAIGLGATGADDIFDAIDANDDGEITIDELVQYLELNSVGETSTSVQTVFKTLDANGDGSISRDELRLGYEEYSEFRRILGLDSR